MLVKGATGNGLAPNWTNGNPVYWWIYVSPGLNVPIKQKMIREGREGWGQQLFSMSATWQGVLD